MSQFINELGKYAVKHGTVANVLPSLILAQGILESAHGESKLAQEANNLFGIKKGTGWSGEVYSIETGEYDENNNYYTVVAEFRKYPSYEGAVIDLIDKYINGLSWENHNRYQQVVGEKSFVSAAIHVKNAGYATDPKYVDKLVKVYNAYGLNSFDKELLERNDAQMSKKFKVVIDAGHAGFGKTPGKRTPAGEYEWTFNNMVAIAVENELKNYPNIEVMRVDDRTGKTDVPLATRAARANNWGADIYISIHHNANTGKWGTWSGVETYVMLNSSATSKAMALAKAVHPKVVNAMGIKNRGIKSADFAVLRLTKMPAILTEGGYMDSTIDILKMRNPLVMKNQGIGIATGAAEFLGVKKGTGSPVTPTIKDPMEKGYLTEGDAGASVKKLQTDLNTLSEVLKISKITADGIFGPATLAALKRFQAHFKLVVDGFYGPTSQAKMKEQLNKISQGATEMFRVRKSWTDAAGQIGAFTILEKAIELAKVSKGYQVYDESGKQVYPEIAPPPANLFRIRLSWSNVSSQIGAYSDLNAAKELADKNPTYKVFNEDGKVVYDPKVALEEKKKQEAAAEIAKARAQYEADFAEAVKLGITDGENRKEPATREQTAVMIVRALKLKK